MPSQADFAYLAGLLDRGGFMAARSIGLKLVVPFPLGGWLRLRFGGRVNGNVWWQTRQADLLILLPRIEPHLKVRARECRALAVLVGHNAHRLDYHGSDGWRARREALRGAVAAARGR